MSDPARRFLDAMTSPQVAALRKDPGVVVMCLGATEQHGAHLPLGTDTLIAEAFLHAALPHLADDDPVWVAPTLPVSRSVEHAPFAGTLTLGTETFRAVLMDVGSSVARAGFRRLALLNGHGGNLPVIHAVLRDLRVEHGLHGFLLHAGAFCTDEDPLDERERRWGMHAGQWETSLVLALDAGLARMDDAVASYPDWPAGTELAPAGALAVGWVTADWSPAGVFGDPTRATAAQGRATLDREGPRLARLLREIASFTPPHA